MDYSGIGEASNLNLCYLTRKITKMLKTHEQIVENSWATYPMSATRFSGLILVLSGDVLNPIFCITMIIFVKNLQMDLCDGLESRTTVLN